jgi:hypothetical protein
MKKKDINSHLKFFSLLLCCVSLFTNSLLAQNATIGNWLAYMGNQSIGKGFNVHNEIQYRNYNLLGDLQQLLVRAGIGYNITENNNNLLLGYAFIHSQKYVDTDEKEGSNEHRIFQQFITRQQFGRVFLQHRYRLEERFLTDDFQLRGRYALGIQIPFNKKTIEQGAVYLALSNELFINLQSPLFDRNRLYGGVGYTIRKDVRIELGMMNQALENTDRTQFQIIVFNNLPLAAK